MARKILSFLHTCRFDMSTVCERDGSRFSRTSSDRHRRKRSQSPISPAKALFPDQITPAATSPIGYDSFTISPNTVVLQSPTKLSKFQSVPTTPTKSVLPDRVRCSAAAALFPPLFTQNEFYTIEETANRLGQLVAIDFDNTFLKLAATGNFSVEQIESASFEQIKHHFAPAAASFVLQFQGVIPIVFATFAETGLVFAYLKKLFEGNVPGILVFSDTSTSLGSYGKDKNGLLNDIRDRYDLKSCDQLSLFDDDTQNIQAAEKWGCRVFQCNPHTGLTESQLRAWYHGFASVS